MLYALCFGEVKGMVVYMIIKQLTIFLENKSGRLTEVTKILGDYNINISALSIADTSEYGLFRLIVSNPDEAVKILKDNGFSVSLTDVFCLNVPHKPGTLHKAVSILSAANISVEYMYAYGVGENASIIMKVSDVNAAIEKLQEHELELIRASEIQ